MKENLTRCEVLDLLFSKWTPEKKTETVSLSDACGRVISQIYHSRVNIPVVRAAAMDGVGVDSARFQGTVPDTAVWKLGQDYVRADTGDDFPDAFDAVIKVEDVDLLPEGGFRLHEGVEVRHGMNIRGCGSTLKVGCVLSNPNLPLRPTDLAALAMGGITEVEVAVRPRVAFIPTGSELVPIGAELKRGCNYDTNSLLAFFTLQEMGAAPVIAPIVPDVPGQLEAALDKALSQSDVVIINGGSSKGSEDFNTRLLASKGELLFHWVKAGPGRPMSIAIIDGKPVINVPGPSIGAFYGLDWCIHAIVCRLLGLPTPERVKVRGKLTADMGGARHVDFLNRVNVSLGKEGYLIHPVDKMVSDLPSQLTSNAMYISPIGEGHYEAGTELEVELLRDHSLLPREVD